MNGKIRVFLCCILFTLLSLAVSAQDNDRVTVSLENGTILDCIKSIEQQTHYSFIFNNSIGLNTRVTVKLTNEPLRSALDKIFVVKGISYEFTGQQILLKRTDAAKGQRMIRGKVLDANQVPIAGVGIIDQDSKSGVTSDLDGRFSITVGDTQSELLFSCLGYSSKTVKVSAKEDNITVYLSEDYLSLDATVVVGYGVQKKLNLTGAISTVSSESLQNRTSPTITHMLQGSVPGLNITTSSGRPGNSANVNIRGINSINGGSPLILIDGAEGDLSRLNANDVESISVIKDASSAAIYGARASFGVILVTTKQGTTNEGKARVNFSARMGFNSPTVSTDYETRGYYSVYLNDLFYKSYAGVNYSNYTEADMEQLWARRNDRTENPSRPWVMIDQRSGRDTYVYYANTDWYHYMFTDVTPQQTYNISLTGGTKALKYYLSGGYDRHDGIFRKNTDVQDKFNFRSKISFAINRWASLSNNTSYYSSSYTYPGPSGVNTAFSLSTVHALASYPVQNPDGTSIYYTAFSKYGVMDGLLTALDKGLHYNKDVDDTFSTMTELTLNPLSGLEVKFNFTYALNSTDYTNRQVNTSYSQYPGLVSVLNTGRYEDRLQEANDKNHYYQANAYGTYTKTFAKRHNFKATAGFNWESRRYKDFKAVGYYLLSENLRDLNLVGQGADGNERTEVSGGQNEYALEGVFGRINYDYMGKYLFEVSGRYDGSSRFAQGHRWGFFPSASAGWRISDENFFKPVKDYVNMMKLRFSYGRLGNQQVGYYDYVRKISIGNQSYLFGGTTKPTTATLSAPVASDLSWETTEQYNLGLDMTFLENRLAFTGEAYIRNTKDMLTAGIALPAVYGASSPKMNSADMRTEGYELSLSWKDMFTLFGKPFNYSASAIFSDYTSEITKFDNPEKTFAKNYYKGMKWGEIWGYHVDGYFKTDEEAASYDVDQSAVNNLINGSAGAEKGLRAGDLKFRDIDGDKKISIGKNTVEDPGDREIIGNTQPRYNYGLTLTGQWMGFDCSVFFQGIGHIDWYPSANAILFWGPYARPYSTYMPRNFHTMIWSEDNPDSYFPRPRGYTAMSGSNRELTAVNDRYLQNIGYCRLKNLTFGYTLPKSLTKKAALDAVRFYFSGENLFTWSGIHSDYIDPEQAMTNSELRLYPWQKTYMFGIDVTF